MSKDIDNHDTPDLISYRLGKVEKGVEQLNDKLDALIHNFATKQDLEQERKLAHKEHEAIRRDVADVQTEVDGLTKFKDAITQKIAAAAITVLVLMVLAIYGLDKYFRG